jgi:phosphoribosylaminoimidazole-succinocarboxamide synthase
MYLLDFERGLLAELEEGSNMRQNAYPLVYKGSVKNVRRVREPKGRSPGLYVFEFTDDYSVFDYGKMPDRICGKGCAIAMMSAYLFEALASPSAWRALFRRSRVWTRTGGKQLRDRLAKSAAGRRLTEKGLPTHYVGLVDDRGKRVRFAQLRKPSNKILVKAVPVVPPKQLSIDGKVVWDYSAVHPGLPQFLVPLENVFRFGVPKGSSLMERLRKDPAYGQELGLESVPGEGTWLPRPVLEFFTKLEPMDRHLRLEEALNFSGLRGDQFQDLSDLSLLVAIFLCDLFLERGLDLWDGKLEFIKTDSGLLLADSITPDELRITFQGTQLSKEPLRQYYKREDVPFCRVMEVIKVEARSSGSIRRNVKARLGRGPKPMEPGFRKIAEQMYLSLAHRVTQSPLFAPATNLDTVVRELLGYERGLPAIGGNHRG